MDGSHQFVYDTHSSESSSEESSDEEGYEKQFQINQGMMYMTSCNINQDIIPLVLQGKLDADSKCICYVGSKESPGNIYLNGVYDIYCDFISYTSNSNSHQYSIGSILTINMDEFNCNNYNPKTSDTGEGVVQCPTKILIPIISANDTLGTNSKNILNTDTIYITSILPTKINKLTLTFSIVDMTNHVTPPTPPHPLAPEYNDIFIIKLILKKTQSTSMSLINKQDKSKYDYK